MFHHYVRSWVAPAAAGLAVLVASAVSQAQQDDPPAREAARARQEAVQDQRDAVESQREARQSQLETRQAQREAQREARRGQRNRRQTPEGSQQQAISLPSADLLRVSADLPAEVRAGQSFRYRVTVSNQSDSVTLHDIKIEQKPGQGVSVDSAQMEGDSQQQQQQEQQEQEQQEQGREEQEQQEQQEQEQQEQERDQQEQEQQEQERDQQEREQSQSQRQQSQQQQQSKNSWTIDRLDPGQSRTIQVQATADRQGRADTCFLITSYTPSLCVTTEVVEPQLELTKNAPEEINICDPLQYEYIVKNPGSGDLEAFTIRDQLPEGVETDSGKQDLEFRLEDGLKAGETRRFIAQLVALRAGTISSRATAKADEGDLETRSQAPETNVVQPELAVAIDGQREVYGRQPVRFTARITNAGDAVVEDVRVALRLPQQTRLAGISELRASDQTVEQSGQQGQPTPLNLQDQQSQDQQSQDQQSQDQQSQDQQSGQRIVEEMVINRLDPGQTVAFDFAVRPSGVEEVKAEIVALYRCGTDREREDAETTSMATTTTKVTLLPDLLVALVDDEGTVPAGSEVTYYLTVRNQGEAPAKDIQATAELPEQLEFVSGEGPTDVTGEGANITVGSLDELGAGEQARWTIRATAKEAGEVTVKVDLKSSYLDEPVRSEEPTTIVPEQ